MSNMPALLYADLMVRARKAGPREICGFLLDDWTVLEGYNVANSDSEFEIDERTTLYAFVEQGDKLMGVYHSHPRGSLEPSQADINNAPEGLRYFIVTPRQVQEWVIANGVATRPEDLAH